MRSDYRCALGSATTPRVGAGSFCVWLDPKKTSVTWTQFFPRQRLQPEPGLVTGTVVTEYRVTTTVTLPWASDFRGPYAMPKRTRATINNILAPHEQEHVDAFETYNGTTEQPFDLNLCRNQMPGVVRKMVRDEERPRRTAAQAASNALSILLIST